MKKVLINILLFITFIIIYLLHSNLFTWFKIAGVMPNLFVIFVLFIGLYSNKLMGPIYGIVFGLLIDLFIGKKMGITSIMLAVVGIIGIQFDKSFSKDNRLTLIVMVITSTIAFEVGSYILNYFVNKGGFEIITFIQILIIECLYNILLTIIFYPLMQICGNKIERQYREPQILTRYF